MDSELTEGLTEEQIEIAEHFATAFALLLADDDNSDEDDAAELGASFACLEPSEIRRVLWSAYHFAAQSQIAETLAKLVAEMPPEESAALGETVTAKVAEMTAEV